MWEATPGLPHAQQWSSGSPTCAGTVEFTMYTYTVPPAHTPTPIATSPPAHPHTLPHTLQMAKKRTSAKKGESCAARDGCFADGGPL